MPAASLAEFNVSVPTSANPVADFAAGTLAGFRSSVTLGDGSGGQNASVIRVTNEDSSSSNLRVYVRWNDGSITIDTLLPGRTERYVGTISKGDQRTGGISLLILYGQTAATQASFAVIGK